MFNYKNNPDENRFATLAKNLVSYSCELKPGDNVLLDLPAGEEAFGQELIKAVYQAGALPFLTYNNDVLTKEWLAQISEKQLKLEALWQVKRMEQMQAYIGVRAKENIYELASVPDEKKRLHSLLLSHPVHHDIRVKKTKWVILRYPNPSMAQEAKMSTENFRDFYFNVCNLDYAKMSRAMDPLVGLMNNTDRVKILAPGTDLRFSIKGIAAIKCDGKRNIPDGEVYTAPVKDSVEGFITYNAPSPHEGQVYTNINLEFSKGQIVNADAGNLTESLHKILDTDKGARYIGEFAIGLNPYIMHPANDILFDEKIHGSFHFTPGASYEDAFNGNESAIHWDLVKILRSDYGGGEIYFDEQLIQKDGQFCLPELAGLNPKNLL
ncbi:MAG: aminopeptidase [Bacillota bacterium]|jgi:aminopeptidase